MTAILQTEAMRNNPFIELSVIAMAYFLTLLYYKKKYADNMKNIIKNRRNLDFLRMNWQRNVMFQGKQSMP